MSWTNKQVVTLVAIIVLIGTIPVMWGVADVRAAQAAEQKKADLVQDTVSSRQAPTDYDGDGINDSSDECPTRPETKNDFRDSDGCPDVVATTGAS